MITDNYSSGTLATLLPWPTSPGSSAGSPTYRAGAVHKLTRYTGGRHVDRPARQGRVHRRHGHVTADSTVNTCCPVGGGGGFKGLKFKESLSDSRRTVLPPTFTCPRAQSRPKTHTISKGQKN